jgi:hypothetical protein
VKYGLAVVIVSVAAAAIWSCSGLTQTPTQQTASSPPSGVAKGVPAGPQVIAALPAAAPPAGSPRADTGKGPPAPAAEPPPVAEKKPVVQAADAADWDGKECTVEMTVRSTKDLGWAVMLNSESQYTSSKNFTAVIVKSTAGTKYEGKGVLDVGRYFRGKRIKVTGTVKLYSGRVEIKVQAPEQIEVVP